MKHIQKIALLLVISLTMVACNKNKKVDPIDTGKTEVIDRTESGDTGTTTRPLSSHLINGNTFYEICCSPNDLSNPESLLSQRVVLFGYDQATIQSRYRAIIAIHARYLSENPAAKIVLEGHADERGTPEYNLALGERRAKSVANLMRSQGVSSGQISVVSFGEEKPVAICNSESCWSQNRRVRIVYTAR